MTHDSGKMSPGGSEGAHVTSLDGVRFVAFLGVFAWHALQNNRHLSWLAKYGALGVQIFFVLSGFLIGGILLKLRSAEALPLGTKLKIFYARRSLRIFPLYYLTLGLLLLLEWSGIDWIGGSQMFFWNATYLTNVKLFVGGDVAGGLAHFWTLAVEEHFYLVAPLLMLTLSTRGLSVLCVCSWLLAAGGRVFFHATGQEDGIYLSPLQFDCMTVGIAAAIFQQDGRFFRWGPGAVTRVLRGAAWLTLPVLGLRLVPGDLAAYIGHATEQWIVAVAVAGLVLALWNQPETWLSRFFALRPMPYLGKISYGLYVFHLPCLVASSALFSFLPHGSAIPAFAMTVGLAMLSWRFFEAPMNNLKRYFSYR